MTPLQPEGVRSGGGVVLLDVDSNHAARRARRRFLAAAGFCVHDAAGAGEAVEAASTHKPQVVLLSPASPDLDAAEVCRLLQDRPDIPLPDIPPIVLLIPPIKDGTELPQCGADLCLPRNLAPALLIEAIRTLLRKRCAERELSLTRGQLESARRELGRSNAELLDFSMQLAHDIEGPLRGVVTFAELIGQAHPLSETERTYLGHVLSTADQVRRLARSFLTYSQAKRDQPRLVEIHLNGVLAAAVHVLRERIKESAAAIQIQDPLPIVLGDFSALQQLLQNLIGNAISYRSPNSEVSITIGAKQESGGESVIFVSDNGIGIAKEYHESIFAPFKRLHGLEIPGAGMGLAISKQIVENHGGRIWVESEPGRGASFLFTLRASA